MRHINEVFHNSEFDQLKELKGPRSWRKFILELAEVKEKVEE